MATKPFFESETHLTLNPCYRHMVNALAPDIAVSIILERKEINIEGEIYVFSIH